MADSLLDRLNRLRYEITTESDDRLVGEAISEIERLQSELDSAKQMIARLRHKVSGLTESIRTRNFD